MLTCAECGCEVDPEDWRVVRIDIPSRDETPELAWYCPDCAERVLGPE